MKHDVVSRRRSGLHHLVALVTLLLGALWLLGAPAAGAYELAPGATAPTSVLGADVEAPSATVPARRRLAAAIRRFFFTLPRLAPVLTPEVHGALPAVRRALDDADDDPAERVGWRTVDAKRGPPAPRAASA